MGTSQYALAKAIGVPPQRVLEIVHGRRAVTADTALRLGRYFGVEPQLWLNLQTPPRPRPRGGYDRRPVGAGGDAPAA